MTLAATASGKRLLDDNASDNASDTKKAKTASCLEPDEYRKAHAIESDSQLPDPLQRFKDTPFSEELKGKLKSAGFSAPTPIQGQAWPILLAKTDLVGVAKTGSGKTLGFLMPAIHNTTRPTKGGCPRVLVLSPTRELAMQIAKEGNKFVDVENKRCVAVYGGMPKFAQICLLKNAKPQVLVATPGRLIDLLEMGDSAGLSLKEINVLIMDEADRMLDMGFQPELDKIMTYLPEKEHRQTCLFTATWPKAILKIAKKAMKDNHVQIRVAVGEELTANKAISQQFLNLADDGKETTLFGLLDKLKDTDRAIIFANTKRRCEYLVKRVWDTGYGACAVHGDKAQWERDAALKDFISGKAPVMFATDVAARGLDIDGVTHVFNYDMPSDVENYIHRLGRTGRAGKTGSSFTFCNEAFDLGCAGAIVKIAKDAGSPVPEFLEAWAAKSAKMGGKKNRKWKY